MSEPELQVDSSPPVSQDGTGKRKRHAWTLQQKKEICVFHQLHPEKTQDDIAQHFSALWNVKLDRTIITKTLKHKETWLAQTITSDNATVKRQRKPSHQGLEASLFEWYQQQRAQSINLTDALLIDQALAIARDMGLSPEVFKASNGWLYKWKKRHNIRSYCNLALPAPSNAHEQQLHQHPHHPQPHPHPHPQQQQQQQQQQLQQQPGLHEDPPLAAPDLPPAPVDLDDARKAATLLSNFVYNNLDDLVLHPADLTYLSGLQSRLERLATMQNVQSTLRGFLSPRA